MKTAEQSGNSLSMIAREERSIHLFTADEWERLYELGIIPDDVRTELIEGEIVEMPPIGPDHASIVDRFTLAFVRRFGERAIVRVQGPVRLSVRTEPLPDMSLLRSRTDFYRARHPVGGDIVLLVEVADTSVRYDRLVKGPLYSKARVAEYWMVDVKRNVLLVFRDPNVATDRYAEPREFGPAENVELLAFPGEPIPVAELLGYPAQTDERPVDLA